MPDTSLPGSKGPHRPQGAAGVGKAELQKVLAVSVQLAQPRLQPMAVCHRLVENVLRAVVGVPRWLAPEFQRARRQPPVDRTRIGIVEACGERGFRRAVERHAAESSELEAAIDRRSGQRARHKTAQRGGGPKPAFPGPQDQSVQPDREARVRPRDRLPGVRIPHRTSHPHRHVRRGGLLAESAALAEPDQLPLGQLDVQPTGIDGVLADPRTIVAVLLNRDRHGSAVGRPFGQQVTLEHDFLAGKPPHVDLLRNGKIPTDRLRRGFVHDHFQRPLSGRVPKAIATNQGRGLNIPGGGQLAGNILKSGVDQQVLRRQLIGVMLPRFQAALDIEIQLRRSRQTGPRLSQPSQITLFDAPFGIELGAPRAGNLAGSARRIALNDT